MLQTLEMARTGGLRSTILSNSAGYDTEFRSLCGQVPGNKSLKDPVGHPCIHVHAPRRQDTAAEILEAPTLGWP